MATGADHEAGAGMSTDAPFIIYDYVVNTRAGSPPPELPEEPTFSRRRPEKPDHSFLIAVAGLLIGSTIVNYIVHQLNQRSI